MAQNGPSGRFWGVILVTPTREPLDLADLAQNFFQIPQIFRGPALQAGAQVENLSIWTTTITDEPGRNPHSLVRPDVPALRTDGGWCDRPGKGVQTLLGPLRAFLPGRSTPHPAPTGSFGAPKSPT